MIDSILIKRFHSIPAERVSLSNLLFFVGANGSGKSNFVDAFAFLSDLMEFPLQTVFDRRGGVMAVMNREPAPAAEFQTRGIHPPKDETLGLAVEFSGVRDPSTGNGEVTIAGRYGFEVLPTGLYSFRVAREQCFVRSSDGRLAWIDRKRDTMKTSEKWLEPFAGSWDAPTALAMPLFGTVAPFSVVHNLLRDMRVYSIEPSKLREMQDVDIGSRLRGDGRNATSVLSEIARLSKRDEGRICELLAAVTPTITKVWVVKRGRQFAFRFKQQWDPQKLMLFDAFNMSDGTLRTLGILLAVYQKPSPSLVVIEEPELTIHPGALSAILDVLRFASEGMQVMATTHSADLLDAKWLTDENLRVVSWQEGATRIAQLGDMPRTALRRHLMGAGELMRSNALQPVELMEEPRRFQLSLFQDTE
jgi:predicted ATPase